MFIILKDIGINLGFNEHIQQTLRIYTFQYFCQHMSETFGELNNCVLFALDLDLSVIWMPESGAHSLMVAQERQKGFFLYY